MNKTTTGQCVLEVRDLTKKFQLPDGKITVLSQLNFLVHKGRSVSIRGKSGSGKSTLLHLFAGLDTPDQGQVFWSDQSISSWKPSQLARQRALRIGLVFQSYHLVSEMNALENVELAGRIAGRLDASVRDRARFLLDRVGLGDRLRQLPSKMSGGERQRVAVARALLNGPSVLLADEPTGNLDEITAGSTMELLLDLVRDEGATLVLVTHSAHFASLCDEVTRLHHGSIEEV